MTKKGLPNRQAPGFVSVYDYDKTILTYHKLGSVMMAVMSHCVNHDSFIIFAMIAINFLSCNVQKYYLSIVKNSFIFNILMIIF